jgi:hypothetical protein
MADQPKSGIGCFGIVGIIFLIFLGLGLIIKLIGGIRNIKLTDAQVAKIETPSASQSQPNETNPPHGLPKTPDEYLKEAKHQLSMKNADRPYGDIYHAAYLLSFVPKDAPEYKEAHRLLKQIEQWKEKDLAALRQKEAKDKKALRQLYAPSLETQFLEKGYDISVKVTGKDDALLTLRYVMFSRPMIYNLTKDGSLFKTWRDMGFSKVIFNDGLRRYQFDLNRNTWS